MVLGHPCVCEGACVPSSSCGLDRIHHINRIDDHGCALTRAHRHKHTHKHTCTHMHARRSAHTCIHTYVRVGK